MVTEEEIRTNPTDCSRNVFLSMFVCVRASGVYVCVCRCVLLSCALRLMCTHQTQNQKVTKPAGIKWDWSERKAREVCEIQASLLYRFNAKTVAMATHSSPAVSGFHSPPPLALLADKVYRRPPTPSDYDMFFPMEC